MMRPRVLVIGCGNLLRGDDAVGPAVVRRLWHRGLPAGVHAADGGTGGMDVAFQMRGVPRVILVDACTSGSEPGTLFEVPGHEVDGTRMGRVNFGGVVKEICLAYLPDLAVGDYTL
ncbi:MAG: hydrogenase maturation protease, partial [Planctomycetaceae bacterium]